MLKRLRSAVCRRLFFSLMSFVAIALAANGQSYLSVIGNPTFATNLPVDGGSLDASNGNLHLDIPISSPTQRGTLSATQELTYDGRIWQLVGTGWQPTNIPSSQAGWRFVTPAASGVSTSSSTVPCDSPPPIRNQWLYRNFSYTDPSGVGHFFSFQTSQQYKTNDPCYDTSQPDVSSGDGLADDGTRYHLYVTNYSKAVVYDSLGNQVYPKIEDRNGNYFSKDANGNLIDTLGNTPVLTTTSGNLTYYDVLGFNGVRNRYTVTTEQISVQTHFGGSTTDYTGTLTAIQSIALPNSQGSYQFTYDSYGELASEILPSGGVVTFGYTNFTDAYQTVNRWTTSRVRDGGTWSYVPVVTGACNPTCNQHVTVTTPGSAPDDTVYSFNLNNGAWNSEVSRWKGSSAVGAGGTKLQDLNTTYDYSTQYVRLTNQSNTLSDVALTSSRAFTYDAPATGNLLTSKTYDFNASNPTVESDYTYGHAVTNAQPALTQLTVVSGGATVSNEIYGYDAGTPASVSGEPNHETLGNLRGNLTSVVDWINSSGSSTLTTSYTVDDAGMPKTSVNSNITNSDVTTKTATLVYNSNGSVATSTTLPKPSSGVVLATSTAVDSNTDALTSSTDLNGNVTHYVSYDWLLRPTEIDYPNGGKYTFASTPTTTSAKQTLSASATADTESLFDGYGRLSRVAVANGQGTNPWYQTDYCYDARGRLTFKSYPYQGTGWSTAKVCSGPGDTYGYDSLDRILLVTHGDGTTVSTSYRGRANMVTDENSVKRITQTDVLGRITGVCEISSNTLNGVAPVSCGMDITGTGFLTSYTYDLANHKTTVVQGAQTRIFQADLAGRTTSVTEPERGITSYSYTYNTIGLQVVRTRPKANQTVATTLTTTTTQYDSTGRVASVTYNDGLTPNKNLYYDVFLSGQGWPPSPSPTNVKGKLVTTSSGSGTTQTRSELSYDSAGNVALMWQCAPSICGGSSQNSRSLSFTYDYANNLISESDAAAGAISYGRSVAGEITSMTNNSYQDQYNPANLVSNVVNTPFGPTSYALGNGVKGVRSYDTLGRNNGSWACVGSSSPNCTGSGATQLYGNSQTLKGLRVTGSCDTILDECALTTYDEFNRLTAVTDQSHNTGDIGSFAFTYDRYGNRLSETSSGSSPSTPVSATNNQVTTVAYDAAGNALNDTLGRSFAYDAEGNVLTVSGGSTAQYVYDALNHRVRAQTSSQTVEYIFDMAGRRISTWTTTNNFGIEGRIYMDGTQLAFRAINNQTFFEHQNWLGTERVRTDYQGHLAAQEQSAPFGDGFSQAVGESSSDQDNNQFTSVEYDAESVSHHAQFRQYSLNQGRWMSPDPYDGSYDLGNPQSLNRYAYVLNNPLFAIDPDGEDETGLGLCYLTASSCGGGGGGGVGGGGIGLGWQQMSANSYLGYTQVNGGNGTYVYAGDQLSDFSANNGSGVQILSDGTIVCQGGFCGTITTGSLGDLAQSLGSGSTYRTPYDKAYNFSWFVPLLGIPGLAGLGPAGSITYIPQDNDICASIGISVGAGKEASAGVLWSSAGQMLRAMRGWSVSGAAILPMPVPVGIQVSQALDGKTLPAGGFAGGIPGVNGSVTYGGCSSLD